MVIGTGKSRLLPSSAVTSVPGLFVGCGCSPGIEMSSLFRPISLTICRPGFPQR